MVLSVIMLRKEGQISLKERSSKYIDRSVADKKRLSSRLIPTFLERKRYKFDLRNTEVAETRANYLHLLIIKILIYNLIKIRNFQHLVRLLYFYLKVCPFCKYISYIDKYFECKVH